MKTDERIELIDELLKLEKHATNLKVDLKRIITEKGTSEGYKKLHEERINGEIGNIALKWNEILEQLKR